MTQWTADQKRAIETIDRSVLVSAAAGSGKTAVLAERCAYLVVDAAKPCEIDELLVVTFTDAAAAEMRERIAKALRGRQQQHPTNARIRRQLAMLDSAQISTIHSFCRNLLNRYFAFVDLEPRMPMLDPLEASQLRKQCAKDVFDALSADGEPMAEAFLNFVAAYGAHEQSLRERVLSIAAFLESHDRPDEWLAAARSRYADADAATLSDAWQTALAEWLARELGQLAEAVETLRGALPPFDVSSWFVPVFDAIGLFVDDAISRLAHRAGTATIDDICCHAMTELEIPKVSTRGSKLFKMLSDDEKAAYDAADALRKDLLKAFDRVRDRVGRFTCSDWAAGIAATAPHVEMLLTAVEQVRARYRDAKRELGVLDFSDLERHTLDLLRDETHQVAERLHGRFRYVLVDEFQDINPIQAEILRLVSTEDVERRPNNLFTVGDVKQSIYRFRLGEPGLFIARHDRFDTADQSEGKVVPLSMNFRSVSPVIDAINAIFERLMSRDLGGIDYVGAARLVPHQMQSLEAGSVPCEVHLLQDPQSVSRGEADADEGGADDAGAADWERIEREAYIVAERIKALHAEGFGFGDIVILMRSMKARIGLFLRRLLAQGVPAVSTMSGDLFDALEVLDVISLLQLLDNHQQDIPLAAVLRSPLLGEALTDSELVEIRTSRKIANRARPFHEAVCNYAATGPDAKLRGRLAGVLERLASWRAMAARRPIADVLWQIYEETGYLGYVSALARGAQRRANLVQLHEYARQFGDFRRQGLHQFIRFIDELRASGEELMAGAVAPQGDAVRIMTIHASKGLEFRAVVLAEAGKLFNLQDAQQAVLVDRKLGVGLEGVDLSRHFQYPTLPHRLVGDAVQRESIAEELRVLYVALTRAKERLVVVGTGKLIKTPASSEATSLESSPVLPLPIRLNTRNSMTWMLAALQSMPASLVNWAGISPEGPALFRVRQYELGDMHDWAFESPQSASAAKQAREFATLAPAGNVSPTDAPLIATIGRRLGTPYAAEALCHVPAVVAASELKRRWNLMEEADDPVGTMPGPATASKYPRTFRMPSFGEATAPESTHVGTWTHELLQRVDLGQACDRKNLESQLAGMIAAGQFTADQAAAIDLDACAWVYATDLGKRLRNPAARVLREWPFVLATDPRRYRPDAAARDADDLLLVRGIVDCLFDDGGGWEVLDYKTDRVFGAALSERAKEYAGQVQIYAQAVEAAFGIRPRATWLAFMAPREIVGV